MRLNDIKQALKKQLADQYESVELGPILSILIEHVTGWDQVQQVIHKDNTISAAQELTFETAATALLAGRPIQYITGKTWFMGEPYIVNEQVLIPRPETEELVDWILSSLDKNTTREIADLCAGSGCIALALKSKIPNAEIIAAELSEEAIALIEENCLKTDLRVIPIKMDVLNDEEYSLFKGNSFDCWVSNPPYIPYKDKQMMSENVLDFEPHIALFVEDNDPLIFYSKLAENAKKYLKNNGFLFFEIHEDYSEEMNAMLKEKGFVNIELRKDLQGKARMMRAQNVISNYESK